VGKRYAEEKAKLEQLIREIKEYQIDGRPSYDVGVSPFEVNEKVVGGSAADIANE
jgi:hypothetical protein